MSLRERAVILQDVVSGALTIREVCERHGLSTQCVVDWLSEFRRASLEAFDTRLRETLESQGIAAPPDIAAPHFVVARGELALPDLIQIMALGRRSGVITVSHDGGESRLWCAEGNVVDAESGKLLGVPAVYRVLSVEHGRISTSFAAEVDRPRRVRGATMELLLEGARRADECNAAKRALGPGCYRWAHDLSAHDPSLDDLDLSSGERSVLNSFSTPTTVAEALAESTLGDLETLTLIKAWVSCDYLMSDAGSSRSGERIQQPAPSHGPQVLSLTLGATQRHSGPAPMLRTLLLGTAAGLVFGLGAWALLSMQDAELRRQQPPGAVARATAAAGAAAGAIPDVRQRGLASAAVARDATGPASPGLVVTATEVAAEPTRPEASSAESTAPSGTSRSSARAPRRVPAPERVPQPNALGAPASMAALDAAETPPEPARGPRMRIIEERVPQMRVVE